MVLRVVWEYIAQAVNDIQWAERLVAYHLWRVQLYPHTTRHKVIHYDYYNMKLTLLINTTYCVSLQALQLKLTWCRQACVGITTQKNPILSRIERSHFTTIVKDLYIACLCIWWFLWIRRGKPSKIACMGRANDAMLFCLSTIPTKSEWTTVLRSEEVWPDAFSTQIFLNHCLWKVYINIAF